MIKFSWRTPFSIVALALYWCSHGVQAAQQPIPSTRVETETLELSPADAIDLVAKFILSGRVDEAESILNQIRGLTGTPAQEQFLTAQIAIRQNRPETALAIYNAMLAKDPSQVRVRIERARLLMAIGRDSEANAEFRLLRQSALPANTRDYIDQFLATLRQRQPLSAQLRLSAGYDSNASAGPDQDSVLLFGLPFQLSDNAQQQGAMAGSFSGAASYRFTLADRLDLRLFGGLRHTEYEGSDFDNTLISAQVGPTFAGRSITTSLFATGYRRWFGGEGLSKAGGGQGVVDIGLSESLRFSLLGSIRHVRYDKDANRNGLVVNTTLRAYNTLGRSSALVGYGSLTREEARVSSLQNMTYRLGFSYIQQWSNQFRMTLTPEIGFRNFKGIQPAFGRDRKDTRYSGAVELVAPPITESQLAPFVTYSYTRNDSSIDFYQFNRHQIHVGVMVTL